MARAQRSDSQGERGTTGAQTDLTVYVKYDRVLTAAVASVGDDHGVDLKETLKVYSPPSDRTRVHICSVRALADVSALVTIHSLPRPSVGRV